MSCLPKTKNKQEIDLIHVFREKQLERYEIKIKGKRNYAAVDTAENPPLAEGFFQPKEDFSFV